MKPITVDRLGVETHFTRSEMGAAAAVRAATILRGAIAEKGSARTIRASSPSQNKFLAGLTCAPEIDWSRVTIYDIDEFVGLRAHYCASSRNEGSASLLE